jgi:hypothetical protein
LRLTPAPDKARSICQTAADKLPENMKTKIKL